MFGHGPISVPGLIPAPADGPNIVVRHGGDGSQGVGVRAKIGALHHLPVGGESRRATQEREGNKEQAPRLHSSTVRNSHPFWPPILRNSFVTQAVGPPSFWGSPLRAQPRLRITSQPARPGARAVANSIPA